MSTESRTYEVRTYGCQMNVHDSERIAGLLDAAGYTPVQTGHTPDVVVFNTCAVRENADNKLYGNLGHLKAVKDRRPGMQIAVGGCMAQSEQGAIQQRAPFVDAVFGTHNVANVGALLHDARDKGGPVMEILDRAEEGEFASALPAVRDLPYAAWVTIQVGC